MPSPFFKQVMYKATEKSRNHRVLILEACFKNGMNIVDACVMAHVARSTYYRWIEEYPEIGHKMELARLDIIAAAHTVVRKSIDAGNTNLAWDLLQKKRGTDYQPPKGEVEVTVKDGEKPKSAALLGVAVGEALRKMNQDANNG